MEIDMSLRQMYYPLNPKYVTFSIFLNLAVSSPLLREKSDKMTFRRQLSTNNHNLITIIHRAGM